MPAGRGGRRVRSDARCVCKLCFVFLWFVSVVRLCLLLVSCDMNILYRSNFIGRYNVTEESETIRTTDDEMAIHINFVSPVKKLIRLN